MYFNEIKIGVILAFCFCGRYQGVIGLHKLTHNDYNGENHEIENFSKNITVSCHRSVM